MLGQVFRTAVTYRFAGVDAVVTSHWSDFHPTAGVHYTPTAVAGLFEVWYGSFLGSMQSGVQRVKRECVQLAGDRFAPDEVNTTVISAGGLAGAPCVPEIAFCLHRYATWTDAHGHGRIFIPFINEYWFETNTFTAAIAIFSPMLLNARSNLFTHQNNAVVANGVAEVLYSKPGGITRVTNYSMSSNPAHQRRRRRVGAHYP